MNLATRLESLEADLAEQRAAWLDEFEAALAAAGTPAELAAFDRTIARSCGETIDGDELDRDGDEDNRVAVALFFRTPLELRQRGLTIGMVLNDGASDSLGRDDERSQSENY